MQSGYKTTAPAKAKFYDNVLEFVYNKLKFTNKDGFVSTGFLRPPKYYPPPPTVYAGLGGTYGTRTSDATGGSGFASTMKDFFFVPDANFIAGGHFVVLGDGSGMGILYRTESANDPGECCVGNIVAIEEPVTEQPSLAALPPFAATPSYTPSYGTYPRYGGSYEAEEAEAEAELALL